MSGLIQRRDEPVLVDAGHNTVSGIFARCVEAGEILSEVAEDGAEETEGIGNDDIDALGVAVVAYRKLMVKRGVGKDDDLVLVKL